MKYFEKLAKEDPGYFGKQMAATRASRIHDSAAGTLVADPKLIKKRFEKAITYGVPAAIGGAGVGALVGKMKGYTGFGAAAGAILAGYGGEVAGILKADKEYLAKKGIELSAFGNVKKMTPEAKKKYLHEKYRGGGYKG
ncbi:hypothetical protein AYK24_00140 [Thermoplasmatales archaeon SG8-52-4]|nr:MAG: hypothetical protein AYK24_00140 [Thermoplasmatales archaeon SG8-52-4]